MYFFKNPRIVSGITAAVLALSVFGAAPLAQAATLPSAQVQAITALLQTFGVDPGPVAHVQAVLENQPVTAQPGQTSGQTTSGTCATLSNGLHLGSSDRGTEGEVSQLQAFLGKDKSIYPEDLVTGYFGTSTLQAVQRWQAAHNIVSSGDSSSTGFGSVGPQTRGEMNKEMETECEQGDSSVPSSDTASSTQSHDSASGSGDN